MYRKKLYRSETNYVIAGVCGGISELTGINSTLIRFLFLLGPISIPAYLILAIILPKGKNL